MCMCSSHQRLNRGAMSHSAAKTVQDTVWKEMLQQCLLKIKACKPFQLGPLNKSINLKISVIWLEDWGLVRKWGQKSTNVFVFELIYPNIKDVLMFLCNRRCLSAIAHVQLHQSLNRGKMFHSVGKTVQDTVWKQMLQQCTVQEKNYVFFEN